MKKRLPLLKENFVNNWLYKVVALTVATAIWVTTLHGRKDTILLRNMELEFILKPSFVVTNVENRLVRVKVSGPRVALKKFAQSGQTISINLVGEVAGNKRVTIRPSDINLPAGVKLISLNPAEIELRIKEVKKQ